MVLVASGLALCVGCSIVAALRSVSMDALFDADLVGVDILQYPVESELSEVNAPFPSAIPLRSFGCQGIDIPESKQESSGRDIPGTPPVEQVKEDRRNYHLEESSSSYYCRSRTPEVASEDSDRSVEYRPKPRPKIGTRTLRGSVGQALQEKRRRQNMFGAVELCDSVTQVEASSAEDTSDVSVLYDMADKAVSMAISRQTEQVSFPAAASSSQVHPPPPPPPPPPPISAGIDCTPTAPPKYAGDALPTTSGQDLHTELVLYDRVVGGAVSVKLKSWQNRVILKAAAEQDIERNMFALVKLCTTAGNQPPPPFELRYLSTVMCQYAGDSTQMFAHVRAWNLKLMFIGRSICESLLFPMRTFQLSNAIYIISHMVQTLQELKVLFSRVS